MAIRHPQSLAIDDGTLQLTYAALDALSNRLAHAILAAAPDPALPVCVLLGQGTMFAAAVLGVLKSGRAYVPLDPSDPLTELQAVVDGAGAELLVSDQANHPLAMRLSGPVHAVLTADGLAASLPVTSPALSVRPDDNACIYFTSGTTGPPKGVVDTHRNVLHNVMRYTNRLGIHRQDRLSLIQSCTFSGTVSSLFSALLNGASVYPFDLRRQGFGLLAEWVNCRQLTMFHSVPLIFEQLMTTGRTFPGLRVIRLEGDQMHPRHVSLFRQNFAGGCLLVNGLGATETGLVRQYFIGPETALSSDVVPVGYPVTDMEAFVRRADGTPAESGEVGEIVVRSAYLAKGYWRRPDLTMAKFQSDPADPSVRLYLTGDLGRLRSGDCLEHLGRAGIETKIRGRRVELAEIESALCALPGIRHALVVVDNHATASPQLVAYLVTRDGKPVNTGKLRRQLSASLAGWMVPAHYVGLAALPTGRHGKLARQNLPPRPLERPILATPYRAPATPEEQRIAACFAAVLKVSPVGLDDDFFDLGGDSLLAAELSQKIGESLETGLSPEALFSNPTVRAIARHLGHAGIASVVYPVQPTGERPPLFCVHVRNDLPSGYRELSAFLGQDQPVYVLRDNPIMVRVEDMAASYLAGLRVVQPNGPYRLCGSCFAGVIAYEMAAQLRRAGEEVSLLALVDTAYPPKRPTAAERLNGYRRRWRRMLDVRLVRPRLARLAESLNIIRLRPWLSIRQALRIAELRYRPPAYDGRTVLFVAGEMSDQAGWQDVCTSGLEIIRLGDGRQQPGEERPHLIAAPHAPDLADALRPLL